MRNEHTELLLNFHRKKKENQLGICRMTWIVWHILQMLCGTGIEFRCRLNTQRIFLKSFLYSRWSLVWPFVLVGEEEYNHRGLSNACEPRFPSKIPKLIKLQLLQHQWKLISTLKTLPSTVWPISHFLYILRTKQETNWRKKIKKLTDSQL